MVDYSLGQNKLAGNHGRDKYDVSLWPCVDINKERVHDWASQEKSPQSYIRGRHGDNFVMGFPYVQKMALL